MKQEAVRNAVTDKYAKWDAKRREKRRQEAREVAGDEIRALEKRIAALTLENETLKKRISELEQDKGTKKGK